MYEGNLKHSFISLVGIFKIQIPVMGKKCLDIANKFPKKQKLTNNMKCLGYFMEQIPSLTVKASLSTYVFSFSKTC